MLTASFRLKIWLIEQTCLFELTWGQGQQLTAQVTYPQTLTHLYQTWQQAYFNFYKSSLRARTSWSGTLAAPPIDWRKKLVEAEAQLLSEFHHWLNSAELLNIRRAIAQATSHHDRSATAVDIFLTCDAADLMRLPWEAWEIGTEFAATKPIRLSRAPSNIQREPVTRSRQGRMRILAILGDETGLDFHQDREAVKSLQRMAEIHFVGWQPGMDTTVLRTNIAQAIADPKGWDILFFAGHSNETALTGGELAIAPNESMLLRELARYLAIAKENGLQFAIFNSCSGLSIAQHLIDLGFNQVAVMREPIHNQVAQEFLLRFVRSLAELKDVQEALLAAGQYLKLEKHLTYPSAYLVPSLFRHPEAPLFRPKPFRWQQQLQQWRPTKREVISLALLLVIGGLPSVQAWLLEQRLWVQAICRQVTEPNSQVAPPPVVLVQIDDLSIQKLKIQQVKPMDRSVIARLIERLTQLEAKVVGIDYLLDRPQPQDPQLRAVLERAIEQQQTWFIFAARQKDSRWFSVLEEIAKPSWRLKGNIEFPLWHIKPIDPQDQSPDPFAYQLVMAQQMTQLEPHLFELATLPQPSLQGTESLQRQLSEVINQPAFRSLPPREMSLQPITVFSYWFHQRWLQPILDFSVPPTQVYETLPAWQLLEEGEDWLRSRNRYSLRSAIVILAAGGYDEAGIAADGADNFPLPPAISHWRSALNQPRSSSQLTGGEVHAYMTHHFLTQHLITPIPDLWIMPLAAVVGKSFSLLVMRHRRYYIFLTFLGCVFVYGSLSLFVYQHVKLLLPVVIPSIVTCIYVLPLIFRRAHG